MPMQLVKGQDSRMKFDATLIFNLGVSLEEEYLFNSGRGGKRFNCQLNAYSKEISDYYSETFTNLSSLISSLENNGDRIAVVVLMDEMKNDTNTAFLRSLQSVIVEILNENELKIYLHLPEWVSLSAKEDHLKLYNDFLKNPSIRNISNEFLQQILTDVLGNLFAGSAVLSPGLSGESEKIEKLSQIIPARASKELRAFIEAEQEESFYNALKKEIEKRGMTEVECYKKANISRKLYWKIKNQPFYKPSKQTAAAFTIALKMDLEDAEDLLGVAGYSLTGASLFDMIIKYHIIEKKFDIYEINNILYDFDQCLLGG